MSDQQGIEWVLRVLAGGGNLLDGLCGERDDHLPHVHDSGSLGRFWCRADQMRRLPAAAERAWRPHRRRMLVGALMPGMIVDVRTSVVLRRGEEGGSVGGAAV